MDNKDISLLLHLSNDMIASFNSGKKFDELSASDPALYSFYLPVSELFSYNMGGRARSYSLPEVSLLRK